MNTQTVTRAARHAIHWRINTVSGNTSTPTVTRTGNTDRPLIDDVTIESMRAQADAVAENRAGFASLLSAAETDTKAIVKKGNISAVDQRHFGFADTIFAGRGAWTRLSSGNRSFTLAVWPELDPLDAQAMPTRENLRPISHERWTEIVYPAIKAAMVAHGIETAGSPPKPGTLRVSAISKPGAKTQRKAFTLTLIG